MLKSPLKGFKRHKRAMKRVLDEVLKLVDRDFPNLKTELKAGDDWNTILSTLPKKELLRRVGEILDRSDRQKGDSNEKNSKQ